jgi:hypothetical protein
VGLVAGQRRRTLPLDLLVPHGGGPLLSHTADGHLDRGLELGVTPGRRLMGRDGDLVRVRVRVI